MRLKINLYELDADISYEDIPAETGGSHAHGGDEHIPASINITSVKIKDVEIISILTPDDLDQLVEDIRESRRSNLFGQE